MIRYDASSLYTLTALARGQFCPIKDSGSIWPLYNIILFRLLCMIKANEDLRTSCDGFRHYNSLTVKYKQGTFTIGLVVLHFTPWSRILEKRIGSQLVKKWPAFYGARRFITAFTTARHLSLSATSIQSMSPSHFLKIHFNIILPATPKSLKWSVSLRFLHQAPLLSPKRATCSAYIILYFIILTIFGEEHISQSSSLCSLLHPHVTLSLLGPNIFLTPCSWTRRVYVPPLMLETKFHTNTKLRILHSIF